MSAQQVTLTINGASHPLTVEVRRSLADVIREEVGLTGTHLGCEHGVCGACTVLLDGQPARACLMLAVQADGQRGLGAQEGRQRRQRRASGGQVAGK